MKSFGRIIRMIRESKEMTRDQLAKNICSSKYIYLIEKGERSPSVEIMTKVGERMKTDLFEYVPYADCALPLEVKRTMEQFDTLRHHSDYDELQSLVQKASKLDDFQKQPWENELMYNEIFCSVYKNPTNPNVLQTIETVILKNGGSLEKESLASQNITEELAKYYNLLAYYYFVNEDIETAATYIDFTYHYLATVRHLRKHYMQFISVALNHIRALAFRGRHADMVVAATDLVAYQIETKLLDRAHASYYFLSQALYRSGKKNEAIRWYKKFICLGVSVCKWDDFKTYTETEFGQTMNELVQFEPQFWRGVL